MCEEYSPMKRLLASIFSGSATTTAKASPGIAVASLSFAGVPIESWVTILTILYMIILCLGALPKIAECIRYFWRLAHPRKDHPVVVSEVESDDVVKKLWEKKDGNT